MQETYCSFTKKRASGQVISKQYTCSLKTLTEIVNKTYKINTFVVKNNFMRVWDMG